MADTGWQTPNVAANVPRNSYDNWNYPDRVKVQNDSGTYQLMSPNEESDYLRVSDFSFDIPTGATIDGVEVGFDRKQNDPMGVWADIQDLHLYLCNAGATIGDDYAVAESWDIVDDDVYTLYGGAADKWGATLTEAVIESSTFGVQIAVHGVGGFGQTACYIDHIQIKVYYSEEAPPEGGYSSRGIGRGIGRGVIR